MDTIPIQVSVAVAVLVRYAVGDTIQDRFRAVLSHLDEGCWMVGGGPDRADMRFRSAVGAVLMSYPDGSAEQEQIASEMRKLAQFSAFLAAAKAGLDVTVPDLDDGHEALGLLGLYREAQP